MADLLTEEEIQALLDATEVQTIEEETAERLCGNILQSIQMNSSRLNMYEMYKDSRLLFATKSIENLYEDKEGDTFYYADKFPSKDGLSFYILLLNSEYEPLIITKEEFDKEYKQVYNLDKYTKPK